MSRFSHYLSIGAALILGAFIIAFSSRTTVSHAPATAAPSTISIASSTFPVLPGPITFHTASTSIDSKNGTGTTRSEQTVPVPTPQKVAAPAPAPTLAPAPLSTSTPPAAEPVSVPAPLASSGSLALDASATALRNALVNIICYVPAGSGLHSISGSGVFIDPKGIILTNAHVAQYFLLADRGVSCTIRSGSPAVSRYSARLIFISSAWVHANAGVLSEMAPSGTGEYDFALLAIDTSVTTDPLPDPFPFVPLAAAPPAPLTPVVIASYGAQFLDPTQVQSSLFPTIVFGSVKSVFTFGVNTVDVLALGGSAAAQEGSSGGGVSNAAGELVGTITTSTVQGATATRSLSAITASYIRAEYASETGQALNLLLAESTSTAIANFAPQMPALESILTAALH
ncbi:MAG: S1 family peptidase [Minisyncoccota bacterium]